MTRSRKRRNKPERNYIEPSLERRPHLEIAPPPVSPPAPDETDPVRSYDDSPLRAAPPASPLSFAPPKRPAATAPPSTLPEWSALQTPFGHRTSPHKNSRWARIKVPAEELARAAESSPFGEIGDALPPHEEEPRPPVGDHAPSDIRENAEDVGEIVADMADPGAGIRPENVEADGQPVAIADVEAEEADIRDAGPRDANIRDADVRDSGDRQAGDRSPPKRRRAAEADMPRHRAPIRRRSGAGWRAGLAIAAISVCLALGLAAISIYLPELIAPHPTATVGERPLEATKERPFEASKLPTLALPDRVRAIEVAPNDDIPAPQSSAAPPDPGLIEVAPR